VLDAGYTLLIDSGTNIHFHNNSGLMVLSTAKVIVNGTLTSPVTFQGDRLGDAYKDVPGQWDRIWFSNITSFNISGCPIEYSAGPGPKGNVFNYAIIKNGYVGLESDTVASAHQPAVVLNNTIIKNFASTGLYAQGSGIQANNCVFANCGEYCAAIYYGGDYRFLHCTFADYFNSTSSNRQTPAVYLQNYYDVVRPLDSAYFGNCIIYGSTDNEIGLDSANVSGGPFNFKFDHCLMKFNKSTAGADHFQSIILNSDPKFADTGNNVYELDPTSPAVNAGDFGITNLNAILGLDLKGNPRPKPATAPDLGAYEVQ
jgi:hypothetical protein